MFAPVGRALQRDPIQLIRYISAYNREPAMQARRDRFFVVVLAAVAALLGGACATPPSMPVTVQPALTQMVQPYSDGLRKAGISSVQVHGNGARVRINTYLGDAYLRYPSGLGAVSFSVYVDPAGIEVDSDTYSAANSAQYESAIKAILPAAIKLATENNARILELRRLDRG